MNATEKCLVLKVGRFREADCWVKLLTPNRGIFNGFAFGGSRSRRRFVGCLDPLSHVLFTIGTNKTGTYTVLEEGTLLHNFPAVRENSARTGLAVNCVKFIEAVEIDPSDAKPAYELLLETLHMLEQGAEVATLRHGCFGPSWPSKWAIGRISFFAVPAVSR